MLGEHVVEEGCTSLAAPGVTQHHEQAPRRGAESGSYNSNTGVQRMVRSVRPGMMQAQTHNRSAGQEYRLPI
jgi:hypothetical protein